MWFCCVLQVKGNVYKNKRVLMDAVHKQKAEKVREKTIADQFEARRAKGKAARERKAARRVERLAAVSAVHVGMQACKWMAARTPGRCCCEARERGVLCIGYS